MWQRRRSFSNELSHNRGSGMKLACTPERGIEENTTNVQAAYVKNVEIKVKQIVYLVPDTFHLLVEGSTL